MTGSSLSAQEWKSVSPSEILQKALKNPDCIVIFATIMRDYPAHIVRFFALMFFQTVILNNISIHGLINPYIYPLFILLLPISLPQSMALLLGFAMGIGIDIFSNTLGLHASASVFAAFCRPLILKALSPPGGYENENNPTLSSMGLNWFAAYAVIFILIHHIVLFFMEVLSVNLIWRTLLKILISSFFSLALILVWEYLFYPKRK